jgi:hypothetical protein
MADSAHRMTIEERDFLIARMLRAKPEELQGYIIIAVTEESECEHRHIRAIRSGFKSRTEELNVLGQAVETLYG